MVEDGKSEILGLKDLISEIDFLRGMQNESVKPTAVIFVSFDIVNSTTYKSKYVTTWSKTMNEILRYVISGFETSSIGGYNFWKALGDEVVYTKEIVRLKDIPVVLDEVYAKMKQINKMIDAGFFLNMEQGKVLGVKGTAWVCDVSSSAKYTRNVYSQFDIKDNRKQMDFSGPDIDVGFRISKYSKKNRLVISWGLAYLLLRVFNPLEFKQKVSAIGMENLHGVWEGRDYPIITYHDDDEISVEESLKRDTDDSEFYDSYAEQVVYEVGFNRDLFAIMNSIIEIIDTYDEKHFNELARHNTN